ncbi:c-type cytochrome [Nitrosophilus alvini]|uniref:c-type cytochrome n=1 Tax=Nitrosophilus alvini TaxID=2714855 RepID=UPI00190C2BA5|nr:hypothetical protein [Nitrosophilus alvini]
MRKRISIAVVLSLVIFSVSGCEQKDNKESKAKEPVKEIKITEGVLKPGQEKEKKSLDKGEFYYSYSKAQEEREEEMPRSEIDAYKNIRSPYEKVQISLMAKKLSKDFLVKCSPCHDDYANGIIGPSLLDKDGDYIYKRLTQYKTKEKANVLMKDLVAQMDEKELKSLANEISEFNKKIRELRN